MKKILFLALTAILLSACSTSQTAIKQTATPTKMIGTYTGLLPCEGCPGIDYQLTLKADHTFEEVLVYQERDVKPSQTYGTWSIDKSILILTKDNGTDRLSIESDKLYKLGADKMKLNQTNPAMYVFNKIDPEKPINQTVALTGKWLFITLNGKTYTNPRDESKKPFIIFDETKHTISGNTGCNNYSGQFKTEGNKLSIGPALSMTKMGCLDTFEGQYIDNLVNIDSYQIYGRLLRLFKSGNEILTFEIADN